MPIQISPCTPPALAVSGPIFPPTRLILETRCPETNQSSARDPSSPIQRLPSLRSSSSLWRKHTRSVQKWVHSEAHGGYYSVSTESSETRTLYSRACPMIVRVGGSPSREPRRGRTRLQRLLTSSLILGIKVSTTLYEPGRELNRARRYRKLILHFRR